VQSGRKTVVISLAGGGFLWETESLLRRLADRYDWHYATASDMVWKARRMGLPEDRIHSICVATTLRQKSRVKRAWHFLRGVADALTIMRLVRPDAVVCVGSSISIALCLAGRLFGARTVFIESVARVTGLSLTGRIIRALRLAQRIYVQWPGMEEPAAGLLYRGMVL
jgi:beta-1,4-N-acetylglucosaminyltransferase